jgi:hypothetical protein
MIYDKPLELGQIITITIEGFGPTLEVCPRKRKEIKGKPQHFEVIAPGPDVELKPIRKPAWFVEVIDVTVKQMVCR